MAETVAEYRDIAVEWAAKHCPIGNHSTGFQALQNIQAHSKLGSEAYVKAYQEDTDVFYVAYWWRNFGSLDTAEQIRFLERWQVR